MTTELIKDILAQYQSMSLYIVSNTRFEVEIFKFKDDVKLIPSGFLTAEAAYFQVEAEGIDGNRMISRGRLTNWLLKNTVDVTMLMTKNIATVSAVVEIDKQTFLKHSIPFEV
ncbi:hypothetical protein [Taibaiella soli]|uniref:Uncharacterized protein n=1 Tax=Taibaiella soli TaxID=1649169 RepID=A0A2W2AX82_9BACT|nr:hypothetical protein [Taibaiella soli]PZF72594.1 hypothetical protein DN068_12065 [Taibaiella soli]